MADLAENQNAFETRGLNLAVIGTGAPKHFNAFRAATGYKGLLFADPGRDAYGLLGFSNSISGLIGPSVLFRGLSALKSGHRQGGIQGNTLQLGGAAVISPEDELLYYFAERSAGEHPDIDDMLACG
ncbi:MAG: AhpC/TSA family protein [Desulfobacterales bacterium]|nr:AhpC/TSA family protein [Desulfobacterales bacterium]